MTPPTRIIQVSPDFFITIARVELLEIRLMRNVAEIVAAPDPEPDGKNRMLFTEGVEAPSRSGDHMFSAVRFEAHGLRPKGDILQAAHVEGVFVVVYKCPSEITEAEVVSFAKVAALYHAWPYWRECLSSSLARIGMPRFTLPLLRVVGPEPALKATAGKLAIEEANDQEAKIEEPVR